MKTDYEFIYFVKVEDKPKTSVWDCRSIEHIILGQVKWYSHWRQYCFYPDADTIFHGGCMQDICHFIGQLKEERKRK